MELKMLDAMLDDATIEEFKWDILHSLFIKGKSLYLFTVLKILRTWESDFYKKLKTHTFVFHFTSGYGSIYLQKYVHFL